jgi:hypothetical protein
MTELAKKASENKECFILIDLKGEKTMFLAFLSHERTAVFIQFAPPYENLI